MKARNKTAPSLLRRIKLAMVVCISLGVAGLIFSRYSEAFNVSLISGGMFTNIAKHTNNRSYFFSPAELISDKAFNTQTLLNTTYGFSVISNLQGELRLHTPIVKSTTKWISTTTLKPRVNQVSNTTLKSTTKLIPTTTLKPNKKYSSTQLKPTVKQTLTEGEVNQTSLTSIYSLLYGFKNSSKSQYFQNVTDKKPCPPLALSLAGEIKVFQNYFPMSQLNKLGFHLEPGGVYKPAECISHQKVAIIIPYRNREVHLGILLLNLHPFLQKQQIEYAIFVVNQIEGSKFNRAMLMNIGYAEAEKKKAYDCLIFHDVDLLPENDRNVYTCPPNSPRHMSVAIDKFNYRLPYKSIMGGIVAIKRDLFVKVNGYSNQFFGWGGEDDDFSKRCSKKSLIITRYPAAVARYQMIKHRRDSGNEANPERFKMLKHVDDRQWRDGLNSLVYELVSIEDLPLYTLINVKINQTDVMNAEPKPKISTIKSKLS